MQLIAWPYTSASAATCIRPSLWPLVFLVAACTTCVYGMTDDEVASLRQDTQDLFYHGYDNYMSVAFPEDELRPISCQPQTRNRDNPADIGLNDVLGNYSLTLIDSLSTLAILASGDGQIRPKSKHQRNPLRDFQDGVKSLVELYGDGTSSRPCGTRACGFDLDSKVQVFETNIRGVGGLLSAHLFAVGDLPIRGYEPKWKESKDGSRHILWKNGLRYHDQLLHLAHDLASRLLPAFSTSTGIPYPRVNLRHGIPFYRDGEEGVCRIDGTSTDVREITENCAAGAGSLILEFATLSRLTGDMRFENLAKQAFWAIWNRRSSNSLVGNGIDAETGQWTAPPLAGIGAGIDSFFEYSLKSSILLSNLPFDLDQHETNAPENFLAVWQEAHAAVKHHIYRDSTIEKHPYYSQVDLLTGAPRYTWIDNLSAYYPGLLVLAGEVEEAAESHLLFSALWTRYSALPERWHAANSFIDPNFRHWAGRPEFIESTFHLYQATQDPFYLHVGEMTLRDIRRRCWTQCGWADLADVDTGELRDRMESFFLGETAKYLFLLFTKDHPLNRLDKAVVFSTEGHPLLVPDSVRQRFASSPWTKPRPPQQEDHSFAQVAAAVENCPSPPPLLPFSLSHAAARPDLFHASALVQLHNVPVNPVRPSPLDHRTSLSDIRSPTNYTFYPWTLPASLIPPHGISSPIRNAIVSTLTFPNLHANGVASGAPTEQHSKINKLVQAGVMPPLGAVQKLADGVLITSLSNLKLSMIQEEKVQHFFLPGADPDSGRNEIVRGSEYRIHGIANWALGKDERVLVTDQALRQLGIGVDVAGRGGGEDEHFRRVKDLEAVDLVVDVLVNSPHGTTNLEEISSDDADIFEIELDRFEDLEEALTARGEGAAGAFDILWDELDSVLGGLLSGLSGGYEDDDVPGADANSGSQASSTPTSSLRTTSLATFAHATATPPPSPPSTQSEPSFHRLMLPALLPTGPGAAPLGSHLDTFDLLASGLGHLPLRRIFFLHSTLCAPHIALPPHVAKDYDILVVLRGDCSFSEKIEAVPAFVPTAGASSLKAILVVDLDRDDDSDDQGQEDHDSHGGKGNRRRRKHDDRLPAKIRPLLDRVQRTPNGFERRYPIPLILVDGIGDVTLPAANIPGFDAVVLTYADILRKAAIREGRFDVEHGGVLVEWDGEGIDSTEDERRIRRKQKDDKDRDKAKNNSGGGTKGMAIKRRYWFESLGVVIGNLGMV